jgi:predicted Zn-dependent protease
MGEANAWLAAGQPDAAARRFEQVARQHDSAAAWNNLASARLRLGDRVGAHEAALHAVQRARDHEPRWLEVAEQTLRETEAP